MSSSFQQIAKYLISLFLKKVSQEDFAKKTPVKSSIKPAVVSLTPEFTAILTLNTLIHEMMLVQIQLISNVSMMNHILPLLHDSNNVFTMLQQISPSQSSLSCSISHEILKY